MKTNVLKNKQNEELVNKDGKVLTENRLEPKDEFIPIYNGIITDSKKVMVNGKEQLIENFYIKALVRNNEQDFSTDDEGVFITLTPTQKKYLENLKNNGLMINQEVFIVYEYTHDKYGLQTGIKLKSESIPNKTFKDFDK